MSDHTPALKGIGHGGRNALASKQLTALNVDWYYDWRSRYTSTAKGFVPMVRDAGDLDENAISYLTGQLPKTQAPALLGFNEPDLKGQADMSVFEALRLWPQLEAAGLRLGSPATIKPNSDWLEEFMIKAEKQGRRVDFMTMHCYGWPNSEDFLRKVEALHEKYQRPVWVTEYAVADFKAKTKTANRYTRAQVNTFMAETVEGMRAMPTARFRGLYVDVRALSWSSVDNARVALFEINGFRVQVPGGAPRENSLWHAETRPGAVSVCPARNYIGLYIGEKIRHHHGGTCSRDAGGVFSGFLDS